MAMEEIVEKEKEMRQLVDLTSLLYDRSQELTGRAESAENQTTRLIDQVTKMEESN